ncbi:MAG: hypothetical protein AVDCRST_MAG68-298, partial [uncultured Gemmatimonadetes bacterium]
GDPGDGEGGVALGAHRVRSAVAAGRLHRAGRDAVRGGRVPGPPAGPGGLRRGGAGHGGDRLRRRHLGLRAGGRGDPAARPHGAPPAGGVHRLGGAGAGAGGRPGAGRALFRRGPQVVHPPRRAADAGAGVRHRRAGRDLAVHAAARAALQGALLGRGRELPGGIRRGGDGAGAARLGGVVPGVGRAHAGRAGVVPGDGRGAPAPAPAAGAGGAARAVRVRGRGQHEQRGQLPGPQRRQPDRGVVAGACRAGAVRPRLQPDDASPELPGGGRAPGALPRHGGDPAGPGARGPGLHAFRADLRADCGAHHGGDGRGGAAHGDGAVRAEVGRNDHSPAAALRGGAAARHLPPGRLRDFRGRLRVRRAAQADRVRGAGGDRGRGGDALGRAGRGAGRVRGHRLHVRGHGGAGAAHRGGPLARLPDGAAPRRAGGCAGGRRGAAGAHGDGARRLRQRLDLRGAAGHLHRRRAGRGLPAPGRRPPVGPVRPLRRHGGAPPVAASPRGDPHPPPPGRGAM